MASLYFSVIVLILIQNVFGLNYGSVSKLHNCDECIRHGGYWCNQKTDEHCSSIITDSWCGGKHEQLHKIPTVVNSKIGKIQPLTAEKTIFVGQLDKLPMIYYAPVERNVTIKILSTTQNSNIDIKTSEKVECDGQRCKFTIETKVNPGFCLKRGTISEYVYVSIKVDNITEETAVKYHVPCACSCSHKVEKNSSACNFHGDYSCGACSCYEEWEGETCEELTACGEKHGDVQCTNPLMDGVCSGNGYCGHCDTCVCYNDKEGSQYFDPDNFCSDVCMDTSGCDQCFTNGTLGPCPDSSSFDSQCSHRVTVLAYNKTTAAERDYDERRVWARCNGTFQLSKNDVCYVEYVAMKDAEDNIKVMIVNSCNDHVNAAIGAVPASNTVPIVLGILGLIAVVAAVAGVLYWKHLSAVPPLPFMESQYQNIDAVDSTGQNPIYIPPVSQFKNPTYGKC